MPSTKRLLDGVKANWRCLAGILLLVSAIYDDTIPEELYLRALSAQPESCDDFLNRFNFSAESDCAVVGSSGILKGGFLGEVIDSHSVVIRLNLAPVTGYEDDVGSRTDIRMINCPSWRIANVKTDEGKRAYLKQIDPSFNDHNVLSCRGPIGTQKWSFTFRQRCMKNIFSDAQLKQHKQERGKAFETTFGFEAISRAVQSCSKVHLYGFAGVSNKTKTAKEVPYHYYDAPSMKKGIFNTTAWDSYKAHNFEMEHAKLAQLQAEGVVHLIEPDMFQLK